MRGSESVILHGDPGDGCGLGEVDGEDVWAVDQGPEHRLALSYSPPHLKKGESQ